MSVLVVAGMLLAFEGTSSADDTLVYPPGTSTRCNIAGSAVQVGDRVVLAASVDSNSTMPEVGSLAMTISTVAGRTTDARAVSDVVWTRTVRYEGSPIEVTGPVLPRGRYAADMTFTPDSDSEFAGCTAATTFRVGGDFGGETDPTDDNGGGGLPNTGGPHLWFLLAGLVLVVAGGGLVGGSRRLGVVAVAPRHRL